MISKIICLFLCSMPTIALALNDKYDPNWDGGGWDFVLYIVAGGIILLINLIMNLFGRKKEE